MNDEIKSDLTLMLTRQYAAGYFAGKANQRIDNRGSIVFAFVVGAIFGIFCGLGLTGWL